MNKVNFKAVDITTYQAIKIKAIQSNFEAMFNDIDEYIPEGREKSLMITKLEEACMWATKAIASEQIEGYEKKRICSECGKEMVDGYCLGGGEEYYCTENCLYERYTQKQYSDMYDAGVAYWTSWIDELPDDYKHDPRVV